MEKNSTKVAEPTSKSLSKPKYENIDYWLNYIDLKLILFFNFFKPWKITVMRFVGTERSNSDQMVRYINRPYIRPISWSQILVQDDKTVIQKGHRPTVVSARYIGTLIYKHK